MRRRVAMFLGRALIALLAGFVTTPSQAEVQLDQATKKYLEGLWLLSEEPVKGSCISNDYLKTQIEFEFRRSGGRALIYVPLDVFYRVAISEANKQGDIVTVTFATWDGQPARQVRFRLLPPNRLQFVKDGVPASIEPDDFGYRCGAANWTVTRNQALGVLQILTSPASVHTVFVELQPGLTDEDVCAGKRTDPGTQPRWLSFEVLGPVHYFVLGEMGQAFKGKLDYARIRSLRVVDDHTLVVKVLGRLPGGASVWSEDSPVEPMTFTATWDGRKLWIRELGMSFVRCTTRPDRAGVPAPLPLDP